MLRFIRHDFFFLAVTIRVSGLTGLHKARFSHPGEKLLGQMSFVPGLGSSPS